MKSLGLQKSFQHEKILLELLNHTIDSYYNKLHIEFDSNKINHGPF